LRDYRGEGWDEIALELRRENGATHDERAAFSAKIAIRT
jgi:hypothetical protein